MKQHEDFLELLQIDYEKYPVIAVVGGRKSNLIYRFTEELLNRDKKVIISTGLIYGDTKLPLVPNGEIGLLKEVLKKEGYAVVAEYEEETGKYGVIKDEGRLEELKKMCDVLLVEIYKRKIRPETPQDWLSILPKCTGQVVSVIPLEGLGEPVSQRTYRMERTAELLKKELNAPILGEDIRKMAASICSIMKNVEDKVYRVYHISQSISRK